MPGRRPPPNLPPPRETIGFAARRTGGFHGPKALGSFLPRLTRKAFEKYGFSAASLVTDWAVIAGKELADYTAPERLKWPRRVDRSGEEQGPGDEGRPGATLVLRVDAARALDVQYNGRQIIERINAYFGYAAVAELRIVQAPVAAPHQERREFRAAPAPLTREVAHIADAGLRNALGRLGAGIRGER